MATYCEKCHSELKPGAKFCGKCGTIVSASTPSSGIGSRVTTDWHNVNRMPQGIALGVDEQIVKKYTIGRYTLRQGSVDVIVTNKRVVRYENSTWFGMQSYFIDEINIDAIQGVSCTMVRSISKLGLSFALIMTLLGLSCVLGILGEGGSLETMLSVIPFSIALLTLINSFRPSLAFWIQGSLGGRALETSVNDMGRIFGRNNTSTVFQFKPTPETTVMLKEIGACIYDLKTLGDKAIEKWR